MLELEKHPSGRHRNASNLAPEGSITHLPCGELMKLNASFALDARCPSSCPMHVDPSSELMKDFCHSMCVPKGSCKKYNPKAPVGDSDIGSCRGAVVDGCEVPSQDGTDACVECGSFFYLTRDRKCARKYAWALYVIAAVLVAVVILILVILVDLLRRPVTNADGLEDALEYRSKQKFRTPKLDGTGRRLYPLSTNLCTRIVGGPGLALHFRFQAAIIAWAAVVAASWMLLALFVDYDLLVLGTKKFGTAFRNCILVAWGRATQRRLMWVKTWFLGFVYVFSVLGSVIFSARQLQFWQLLDDRNDTMKDYALRLSGLPWLEGSVRIEEELKESLQLATGHTVVDVSVCWDYCEHQDAVRIQLQKTLDGRHRQGSARRSQAGSSPQDMSSFQKTLFRIEQMILAEDGDQELSEEDLHDVLTSLRCCSTAFAVFETERARDEAVRALSSGLCFRDAWIDVSATIREPHGVNWKNMNTSGFTGKLERLGRGIVMVLLGLALYLGVFYAPYAWSILKFNYEGGQQPGMVYTIAFSLIVCVGNLMMAEMCSRVADTIGFEYKETRENCYMVLYLLAIVVNVGLDLWTTYYMASQIMIGLDFRTEDGRLLVKVESFLERFESYALQRSMGQQLYEYAFPCTFLVPFLAEPLAVIFSFSRLFMLLVRSHPELKSWESRGWLAALDLELGRYADCLVNVFLAVLVFFFPGGYTHWVFALLAGSHAYIYAYDHYRVLRVVPRIVFQSMNVDFCAQVLLAPACGILLVCLIFKGNCTKDAFHCLEPYPLFGVCIASFLLHCAVHTMVLWFLVPCIVLRSDNEKIYRTDAKTFKEVAAEEPCSWFTANPIHCLRSWLIYKHDPPCSFYVPGMEHTMQVNENIGCYFTETDETVEDVQSYLRLPSLHDLKHALADADDDDTKGDTGATG
ncbi:DIMT1 [Symbiodinium natans]|uniref:DIMT1 protein n=1 Tax=Symbiodinium natans TaxID=878477 RepID=A0A812VE02_9DINO|nr:DIMT1 [Symbiodinium natans]